MDEHVTVRIMTSRTQGPLASQEPRPAQGAVAGTRARGTEMRKAKGGGSKHVKEQRSRVQRIPLPLL
jgi:hypothetical protein